MALKTLMGHDEGDKYERTGISAAESYANADPSAMLQWDRELRMSRTADVAIPGVLNAIRQHRQDIGGSVGGMIMRPQRPDNYLG